MKKASFTILITLLLSLTAQAQSCLPDGITFSTQAHVDQFPAMYPGCATIEGPVHVRTAGVTNLDSLESIGGSFWLYYTSLQDMNELNKLSGFVAHRLGRNQIGVVCKKVETRLIASLLFYSPVKPRWPRLDLTRFSIACEVIFMP